MILYKYYPDNIFSFRALSVKGLWCHFPKNMNDPYECLGFIDRKFSKEQLELFRSYIIKSNDKTLIDISNYSDEKITFLLNKHRKEIINRSAFCSLSECFDDIKMWSHYASGHTGFVIGLEFDEIEIDNNFHKVKYVRELPELDIIKLAETLTLRNQDVGYYLSDISIKSECWKDEKEYRIWRSKPSYYRYKTKNIRAVIFGLNCNAETKMMVLKTLTDLDNSFQFGQMEFGDNPISLKI